MGRDWVKENFEQRAEARQGLAGESLFMKAAEDFRSWTRQYRSQGFTCATKTLLQATDISETCRAMQAIIAQNPNAPAANEVGQAIIADFRRGHQQAREEQQERKKHSQLRRVMYLDPDAPPEVLNLASALEELRAWSQRYSVKVSIPRTTTFLGMKSRGSELQRIKSDIERITGKRPQFPATGSEEMGEILTRAFAAALQIEDPVSAQAQQQARERYMGVLDDVYALFQAVARSPLSRQAFFGSGREVPWLDMPPSAFESKLQLLANLASRRKEPEVRDENGNDHTPANDNRWAWQATIGELRKCYAQFHALGFQPQAQQARS